MLYFILGYFFKKSSQLTSMQSASKKQEIPASKFPGNSSTSNYAISTWFYVEDWNTRYGEDKPLLIRGTQTTPCPYIYLGPRENNIHVQITTYEQHNNPYVHNTTVRNFPLQKWVNLIVSVYGRTLDIYIDGKLDRSDVLPGVARPCLQSGMAVTGDGGFNGWTSNIKYWSHALSPQEAYDVYVNGYGGSFIGNIFNKYRVKIAFLEDNHEEASFEI